MLKAYKYRLLPTDEQKEILSRWMGMCRFVYNLGLETKIAAWTSAKKNLSCFDLNKQVTELKKTEATWLAECNAQSLESSINNLDTAFTKFFKGSGFPKFKKKGTVQSITFRQAVKTATNKVYLPKIGWVDMIEHRPIGKGDVRTCVVSQKPSGGWYISILIQDNKELPKKKKITDKTTIGIDVGLKSFATLSDGQKFDNPKYLHHQLKRLRIEQRKLQRKFVKGAKEQSKGYYKQKLVVAKLHDKISNQRQDFLHKTSTAIIKQFDTICLEDLNIVGMLKNNKVSKAISDVSWNEFNRMINYKSEWYGKNIKYIGRFEPSSKICSTCGHIFKELKLSDRVWTCEKCGTNHDRDENAAKNIKNFGFKARPSTVNVSH